jgi:hypothetical protein
VQGIPRGNWRYSTGSDWPAARIESSSPSAPVLLLSQELASIESGDGGRGQGVLPQGGTHRRPRCVGLERQIRNVESVDSEDVAVGRISNGRTRTTVAGAAKVGATLHTPGGSQSRGGIARPCWEIIDLIRDVEDNPMPPATLPRSVGVKQSKGETACAGWRADPTQLGGAVAACEDVLVGDDAPVLHGRARQAKFSHRCDGRGRRADASDPWDSIVQQGNHPARCLALSHPPPERECPGERGCLARDRVAVC